MSAHHDWSIPDWKTDDRVFERLASSRLASHWDMSKLKALFSSPPEAESSAPSTPSAPSMTTEGSTIVPMMTQYSILILREVDMRPPTGFSFEADQHDEEPDHSSPRLEITISGLDSGRGCQASFDPLLTDVSFPCEGSIKITARDTDKNLFPLNDLMDISSVTFEKAADLPRLADRAFHKAI